MAIRVQSLADAAKEIARLEDMIRGLTQDGDGQQRMDNDRYDVMSRSIIDQTKAGILAERPTAAEEGRLYLATDVSPTTVYVGDGTNWQTLANLTTPVSVANGGTGLTSYTIGDLLIATAAATIGKLAAGADGRVLRGNGAGVAPAYEDHSPVGDEVTTSQSATSASFVDLATAGPTATVTITALGKALVCLSGKLLAAAGATAFMGFAVSGATTIAASTQSALQTPLTSELGMGACFLVTGLTAGSNTFRAKYSSGTPIFSATFADRQIAVIPY